MYSTNNVIISVLLFYVCEYTDDMHKRSIKSSINMQNKKQKLSCAELAINTEVKLDAKKLVFVRELAISSDCKAII